MAGDWSSTSGVGVVGGVGAGAVAQGGVKNAPVTVGTSDVPINLPTGSWRYVRVIVVAADAVVATAVNEPAVLGTAGTPPDPTWGAGDVSIGPWTELKPVSKANGAPLIGGTDVIHLIASATTVVWLAPTA